MTATPELAARYLAEWRRTPLPPTEEGPRPPHPSQAQSGTRDGACGGTLQRGLRYTDPLADVTGHDAIEATIAAVQAQFPGSVFRLAGPVDVHHDQVRFTWHLGPEGQEAPVVGSDVAVTDDNGRIRTALAFLDRVPATS